ncbi:MAG TPA: nicotinate-nucleotide adenylyltransferase [Actinomycetota bacterium]|nr:nicotinate-nucleotide adenylyltransferase [Actinomycetota bacterium]
MGVMGGTFDPIHVGHLVTAEEALHQFALDEVVFVPTGRPWMKEHDVVASAEDRYAMTAMGIEPEPRFHVSRIEVDRGGATYTVDTLRALRDEVPGAELFFITGADAMLEIMRWKEPETVFDLAHFIAATRPGYDVGPFDHIPDVTVMRIPALAISSTDIRARVHDGRPIRFLVPEGVEAHIRAAGLYR